MISIRSFSKSTKAVSVCLAAILVFGATLAAHAALPASSDFGPVIDNVGYDGQTECSPKAKPGMLEFRRIVMARYPTTGLGGISRACNIGGQSEHKEGRAWDWGVNAAYPSHREIVQDLFEWLLAEDRYGNEAAMAKRFGIMYIIWNRKIWGSWGGWSTYCVQRPRGCVDPEDKDLRSPHTDHVHFSMSRAGAKMKTTFWNKERSMLAGMSAHPSYGYWELGRNGGIASYGTGWYGSKSDVFLGAPAVAMAPTVSGGGYWIVTRNGRVFPFGDAKRYGQVTEDITVVDIEPTPTGGGYWLLARSGRVLPFGDAIHHGGALGLGNGFASMAATPSGLGYWLFSADGGVMVFGDAPALGELGGDKLLTPVIGADNYGASGYWLATAGGRVAAFGDAPDLGQPETIDTPIVGFVADPSSTGYWVLSERGSLWSFGDAPALGTLGN